jgi:exosortase family protein XrtM
LEVVLGCDGSAALFLIMTAVIAFSVTIKLKVLRVFLGVLLVYLLNRIRIVGLNFVVAYQWDWFLPIHTYFAPHLDCHYRLPIFRLVGALVNGEIFQCSGK